MVFSFSLSIIIPIFCVTVLFVKCYLILMIFIMKQMTTEERVLLIKTFYENNGSFTATSRELHTRLERNVALNESLVRRLVKKFKTIGSVLN